MPKVQRRKKPETTQKKTIQEEVKKGRRGKGVLTPEEQEVVRQKLRPGEGIRKDGRLIYRPTKADYNGGEAVNPIYASTLEELREKERELLNRLDRRLSAKQTKASVDDLFKQFYDIKKNWIRGNTLNNYEYFYNHFVRGTKFGRSRATTIKKSDVIMLYNDIVCAQNVSVSSLESLQNVLHQMFAILKDDDLIPSNPADNALCQLKKTVKLGKSERVALSVPEQYLFFNYLEKHPEEEKWYRLLSVMLGTGMRIAEVAGLRWCDIDFKNGVIRVEHALVLYPHPGQKPTCVYEMHAPKTEAGRRTIPMLPFVRKALEEERAWQNETGEHSTVKVDGYDGFVFFNRFGQPQHQGSVNKAIRRLIRDCNQEILLKTKEKDPILVPPFSCHILRHTCATRLIESGRINPIVVQSYMGHASLETTMDIYVNCTENFKRRAFGLDKGKTYPNIFDDALKDIPIDTPTLQPHNYAPGISRTEASRISLTEFTQNYSKNTQSPFFDGEEL